jgi:hypothetical protein
MKYNEYCILVFFMIPFLLFGGEKGNLKGLVFSDTNHNGILDSGEPGIAGVCVSNGKEVVQTDANGKWELPGENTNFSFCC